MSYKINEIFYSLQGEGRNSGMPCVFIRFSGCNLKCGYCDTDHIHGSHMDISAIIRAVTIQECNNIVLTGGEPMLQLDKELLKILKSHKFKLFLETNGSINKPDIIKMIDWVTVSPKSLKGWKLKHGDELKLVLTPEIEIQQFYKSKFRYHYLQPCYKLDYENIQRPINLDETISKINLDPRWSLSLQLQKHFNWR